MVINTVMFSNTPEKNPFNSNVDYSCGDSHKTENLMKSTKGVTLIFALGLITFAHPENCFFI